MKKSDRKQLYKLLEQWSRAEIMARLGRFDNLEFLDYAAIKIEKENEIRKLLYGSEDLLELGLKWGLVKSKENKRKIKSQRDNKRERS